MGNINYDYDEVISLCQSVASDVEELFNSLNKFESILGETEELFHAATSNNNLTKIYCGFSNIIGSTSEVSGLGGIGVKSKDTIDIVYSEALNDKNICENTGTDDSTPGFIDDVLPPANFDQNSEINESNVDKYIANFEETMEKIQNNTPLLDTMINFFKGKGLTNTQIAGVIGNACRESGLVENAQNPESSAHGLFQWLRDRYPADWDVQTQLEHAWEETLTRTDRHGVTVIEHLNTTTTAAEACDSFRIFFEGGPTSPKAQRYSQGVLYYMENVMEA